MRIYAYRTYPSGGLGSETEKKPIVFGRINLIRDKYNFSS